MESCQILSLCSATWSILLLLIRHPRMILSRCSSEGIWSKAKSCNTSSQDWSSCDIVAGTLPFSIANGKKCIWRSWMKQKDPVTRENFGRQGESRFECSVSDDSLEARTGSQTAQPYWVQVYCSSLAKSWPMGIVTMIVVVATARWCSLNSSEGSVICKSK